MILGVVGAVAQNGFVALIYEVFENLAVMHVGRDRAVLIDEFTFGIHLGVVLVAVVGLVVLLGPTCIAIFLTTFRGDRVEPVGAFAVFDLLVLLTGVWLAGSVDKTGINDAAFFGDESFASEFPIKGFEEFAAPIALVFFNEFFEVPNRIGVGHFVAEAQSQKTHEAEAILNLSFGGLVAEAMVFLKDEDLEHEKRIKRRASSFLPILRIVAGVRASSTGRKLSQSIRSRSFKMPTMRWVAAF